MTVSQVIIIDLKRLWLVGLIPAGEEILHRVPDTFDASLFRLLLLLLLCFFLFLLLFLLQRKRPDIVLAVATRKEILDGFESALDTRRFLTFPHLGLVVHGPGTGHIHDALTVCACTLFADEVILLLLRHSLEFFDLFTVDSLFVSLLEIIGSQIEVIRILVAEEIAQRPFSQVIPGLEINMMIFLFALLILGREIRPALEVDSSGIHGVIEQRHLIDQGTLLRHLFPDILRSFSRILDGIIRKGISLSANAGASQHQAGQDLSFIIPGAEFRWSLRLHLLVDFILYSRELLFSKRQTIFELLLLLLLLLIQRAACLNCFQLLKHSFRIRHRFLNLLALPAVHILSGFADVEDAIISEQDIADAHKGLLTLFLDGFVVIECLGEIRFKSLCFKLPVRMLVDFFKCLGFICFSHGHHASISICFSHEFVPLLFWVLLTFSPSRCVLAIHCSHSVNTASQNRPEGEFIIPLGIPV